MPEPGEGGDRAGLRVELADRIERWIVPIVRWVRRTLRLIVGSGVLALALAVAATVVQLGPDGDGLVVAGLIAALLAVPVVVVGLFVQVLGELERLPETVRAAPDNVGALKGEVVVAAGELRELRRSGLFGLPAALTWLRRTIGRMDALGVAGVAAALAALHPVRLAWTLLLCGLAVVALPLAALALALALIA